MFEIHFLTLLLSSLDQHPHIRFADLSLSLVCVCVVILFLIEIRKKNKKKKRNFLFFGEFYLFVICARIYYKCSGLLTFPDSSTWTRKGPERIFFFFVRLFFFCVFNWTQQLREKIINWLFGNERRWIEYSRPHGLFKVLFFFSCLIFFFLPPVLGGGGKSRNMCRTWVQPNVVWLEWELLTYRSGHISEASCQYNATLSVSIR